MSVILGNAICVKGWVSFCLTRLTIHIMYLYAVEILFTARLLVYHLLSVWEQWIEFIGTGIPCVKFTILTKIIRRGDWGFLTGCPCVAWYRGLTHFSHYFGPNFGKSRKSDLTVVSKIDIVGNSFHMYVDSFHRYIHIPTDIFCFIFTPQIARRLN